jgi:hypothetical protein
MAVCRFVTRLLFTVIIIVPAIVLQQPAAHAAGRQNGIVTPTAEAVVTGVVEVDGVAQHASFRKWQLDLLINGDATHTRFIAVGEKMRPIADKLAELDTTRYPDGRHLLRLRVVYTGLNYDEYLTPIAINNKGASPNAATDEAAAGAELAPEPVIKAEVLIAADGVLGAGAPDGPRRVEVDISDQTLTAWQGETVVLKTQVSTGKPGWRTLPGTFHVYVKLPATRMVGPDYDTPDVPWTMYYYQGFALHGAYWHNNFGRPVSHGCVNLRVDEAKLLFDWASVGMEVVVQE